MLDFTMQFDELDATDITSKFIYAIRSERVIARASILYYTSNKEVLIQDLFVRKEFRKQGVAKQFLETLMKQVQAELKVSAWACTIDVTNEPSKALFASLGFELNSSRGYTRYYSRLPLN